MRGVPVRISEDGWAAVSVVQAVCAALSYAAIPADIHAALTLRTLGPEPLDLQYALASQMDGVLADDAVLMHLAGLSARLASLPVPAALDLVSDGTGIWTESLSEAAQARADL